VVGRSPERAGEREPRSPKPVQPRPRARQVKYTPASTENNENSRIDFWMPIQGRKRKAESKLPRTAPTVFQA
jgi:hypothetical protein